jgi:hypothetical protein
MHLGSRDPAQFCRPSGYGAEVRRGSVVSHSALRSPAVPAGQSPSTLAIGALRVVQSASAAARVWGTTEFGLRSKRVSIEQLRIRVPGKRCVVDTCGIAGEGGRVERFVVPVNRAGESPSTVAARAPRPLRFEPVHIEAQRLRVQGVEGREGCR